MRELSDEEKTEIFCLLSQLDETCKRIKILRKHTFELLRKYSDRVVSGSRIKLNCFIKDYTTTRLIKILRQLFQTGELRD